MKRNLLTRCHVKSQNVIIHLNCSKMATVKSAGLEKDDPSMTSVVSKMFAVIKNIVYQMVNVNCVLDFLGLTKKRKFADTTHVQFVKCSHLLASVLTVMLDNFLPMVSKRVVNTLPNVVLICILRQALECVECARIIRLHL